MKSNKIKLKVDWATHDAASYACKHWHYSQCMPVGKIVKVGVWENDIFIGVVLFSRGANRGLMSQIGLKQIEGCELTRIALNRHHTPVTRIIRIAFLFLKKSSPGMKVCFSFADKEQNHHGGIYQGGNWIYLGETLPADEYIFKGKRWHGRAFRKSNGSHLKYLDKGLQIIKGSQKHRYLYIFDKAFKKEFHKKEYKYPKRGEHESNAPDIQSGEGGVVPTGTHHLNKKNKQNTKVLLPTQKDLNGTSKERIRLQSC